MTEPSLRERVATALHRHCCGCRELSGGHDAAVDLPAADAVLAVVRGALPDHMRPFRESEADWMAGWNECLGTIEGSLP